MPKRSTPPTAIYAAKSALRERAKAAREALPAAYRRACADRLAQIDLSSLAAYEGAQRSSGSAIVSAYRAIGSELDPGPLLTRLTAEGYATCLPVTPPRGEPLRFRTWSSGDPLVERKWGIMEPPDSAPLVDPHVLLVPLLAFDKAGWRLGYGGGYYDRTLSRLRALKPVIAIGLAFDKQEIAAVPHDAYDQRLDWVLTPSGARQI